MVTEFMSPSTSQELLLYRRFVDIVVPQPNGDRSIDYRHFHSGMSIGTKIEIPLIFCNNSKLKSTSQRCRVVTVRKSCQHVQGDTCSVREINLTQFDQLR
jgi:hypothetical protein